MDQAIFEKLKLAMPKLETQNPGAMLPDFIEEYAVQVTFVGSDDATHTISVAPALYSTKPMEFDLRVGDVIIAKMNIEEDDDTPTFKYKFESTTESEKLYTEKDFPINSDANFGVFITALNKALKIRKAVAGIQD